MAKEGRPLKFETVKELEEKIQAYFAECFEEKWIDEEVRDAEGNKTYVRVGPDLVPGVRHIKKKVLVEIPVISGLAYHLGTTRRTLLDYEEKDEFSHTIKEAKQFIESCTEKGMVNGKINPTAGIFNMKNNWGWVDKTEQDLTSKGERIISGIEYITPKNPNKDEDTTATNMEATPGVASPGK